MWARTGVLSALALVLSYVETFIPLPVPIPGAKLGLANIPILMALKVLDARSALIIAVTKTLVVSFLFGSPIMIPYSAAGTLLAFTAMYALLHVRGLHVVLISIVGSVLHIVGQLAVASLMLGTLLVWYTFPLLAVIACVTGALTGKATDCLLAGLEAGSGGVEHDPSAAPLLREAAEGEEHGAPLSFKRSASVDLGSACRRVDVRVLLLLLVGYLVATLCLRDALALAGCGAVALAWALAARVRPRDVVRALVPLLSILVITTVAQVLYAQQGTVIVALGPLNVTEEALATVALMIVRLACVMLASVAFMRMVSTDDLIGALAFYLRPLERLGVRVDAFILSLDLAFQFIPVLLGEFGKLKEEALESDPAFASGGFFRKLRGYQTLLAPLAARSFAYADHVAEGFAQAAPPAAR